MNLRSGTAKPKTLQRMGMYNGFAASLQEAFIIEVRVFLQRTIVKLL